jgi:hypothetical protein
MKRHGSFVSYIGKRTFWQLWWLFLLIFIGFVVLFAALYWVLGECWPDLFFTSQGKLYWAQAFYLSFATQLTIGAGNFIPEGWYQPVIIVQSIVGVALFGIWSGIAVTSFMTAHPKTIRFARWAGYDLHEERFFVLFVNRNVEYLSDVSITAIAKLGSVNPVRTAVNPPYVGRSVWPFGLAPDPVEKLAATEFEPDDRIKFGISGKAGDASFSRSCYYELSKVYVQNDRNYSDNEQFKDPKFDTGFEEAFESRKPGAVPFLEFDFRRYWTEILDLAEWMHSTVVTEGYLRHDDIPLEVKRRFAEGYIGFVPSTDSDAAQKALIDFLVLTEEKVMREFWRRTHEMAVWVEDEQLWRRREPEEPLSN